MNAVRKIAKNSCAAFITRISFPLSSFVFVFLIGKYLGVSGVGIFSSAMAILIIFQAFSCLGFQHLITKEVAQDKYKAGKFLTNASFIGGCLSVIVAGLMCAIVHIVTDDDSIIRSVYVLSVSLIPYTLGLVCQSISRGFEKLEHITYAVLIANGFKLLFGTLVLYRGFGLIGLMVVISASFFLNFFISLYLTLKSISEPLQGYLKIDTIFCRWMLRKIPVFAFIFIVATIRMYINVPLLTSMMGVREVGFYDAAYRLINISSLGISFFIIAVQPAIFRLYKSSMEKFEFACTESIRYFFIIIIPIIAGMTLLGDRFILIIFEPEFLPAALVLNILIWILMLNGFNQILASALISSDHQKINLKANILGMISNITLCVLLIPKFSFIGAGIANISAAFITFVYQYSANSKLLFKIEFFNLAHKPFMASFFLGVFVFLFKDINLFILITLSVIAYTILIFAFKVFSSKDFELLRSLWNGNGGVGKIKI